MRKKHEEQHANDYVLEEPETELLEQVQRLKERLRACEKERKEYLEGWQRAKADFVNARKGSQLEALKQARIAKENMLRDILPVLDSFESAFADAEAKKWADEKWRIGIEHIYQQCKDALARWGVEPIYPLNEPFDPAWHDSVKLVPTTDKRNDNRVVEVLQTGYRLEERVLRPAKVGVAHYKEDT